MSGAERNTDAVDAATKTVGSIVAALGGDDGDEDRKVLDWLKARAFGRVKLALEELVRRPNSTARQAVLREELEEQLQENREFCHELVSLRSRIAGSAADTVPGTSGGSRGDTDTSGGRRESSDAIWDRDVDSGAVHRGTNSIEPLDPWPSPGKHSDE
jgi:hypothetical protein